LEPAGEQRAGPQSKQPRTDLAALLGLLIFFVALAAGTLVTRLVAPNEGWFADPAFHLATRGVFSTTSIETTGTWLEGLNRHTYWILPLYPVAQAPLFRLFGFSLYTMRSASIFWGVIALTAVYLLIRSQTGPGIALLASLLLATDFHFLVGAATGRMDMMCAALGFSGLAVYMLLRQRSLPTAILLSHTLVAAACLTHPCGVLALGGLVLLMFRFDRQPWRWQFLPLAALPYMIGLAGYAAYALEDWPSFVRQLSGNVCGLAGEAAGTTRFGGLLHPWTSFSREVQLRYISAFIGKSWRSPYRAEIVVLLLYWGGATVALLDRRVRCHPLARLFLPLTALYFVALWLFEGLKLRVYLVHTLPLFAALGALWIWNWTEGRKFARVTAVAVILCIQGMAIADGYWENQYHTEHLPAATFMQEHGYPGSLIMASGQFVFEFGFDGRLVDDVRLGFFTGKRPEFYIRDIWYDDWLEKSKTSDPAVYQHVTTTLAQHYREVFHNAGFKIYQSR
jgi:4-amino-4-deoxy-L-arabinose transferase-like glycosyltransferase